MRVACQLAERGKVDVVVNGWCEGPKTVKRGVVKSGYFLAPGGVVVELVGRLQGVVLGMVGSDLLVWCVKCFELGSGEVGERKCALVASSHVVGITIGTPLMSTRGKEWVECVVAKPPHNFQKSRIY